MPVKSTSHDGETQETVNLITPIRFDDNLGLAIQGCAKARETEDTSFDIGNAGVQDNEPDESKQVESEDTADKGSEFQGRDLHDEDKEPVVSGPNVESVEKVTSDAESTDTEKGSEGHAEVSEPTNVEKDSEGHVEVSESTGAEKDSEETRNRDNNQKPHMEEGNKDLNHLDEIQDMVDKGTTKNEPHPEKITSEVSEQTNDTEQEEKGGKPSEKASDKSHSNPSEYREDNKPASRNLSLIHI